MKILIADDHQLLADALAQLVKDNEADSEILQAASLDDAMETMDREDAVEIVLVDYDLPGLGRGRRAGTPPEAAPPSALCNFLWLGRYPVGIQRSGQRRRGLYIEEYVRAGFFHAIKLMQVGEKFIPAGLYENIANQVSVNQVNEESADSFVARTSLSPREIDVLRALVKGISNRQIGQELGVEEVTIKLHLRRIYKKIGVANRTQAVKLAMANGIG